MKTGKVVRLDSYRQNIGARKNTRDGEKRIPRIPAHLEDMLGIGAQNRDQAMLSISGYVRGVLGERTRLVAGVIDEGAQTPPRRQAVNRFRVLAGGKD